MENRLAPLREEEWKQWADLTRRIQFINGKIPLEAFYAFCEVFISPVVEIAPYRIINGTVEILLIYR